jgi:hypothetical protein
MAADAFLTAFVAWAERRDDVKGLLLVGSRARIDMPADEWSDVDLTLVVDEPGRYLDDGDWLEEFGRRPLRLVPRIDVRPARRCVPGEQGQEPLLEVAVDGSLRHQHFSPREFPRRPDRVVPEVGRELGEFVFGRQRELPISSRS